MVLLLTNRLAKAIGGYLPKSLQWSSNARKISATLCRQAKENKERGWALLHLRDLVTHSSSLTPLNRGSPVLPEDKISSGCRASRKRVLMEIFGAQILVKEKTIDINTVLDENLASRSVRGILYGTLLHKNLKINSEGYVMLCGPDRGIEIKDRTSMRPNFNSFYSFYDCYLCHYHETRSGFLVVNYAMYSDGLEAKICIAFNDLKLLMEPEIGTPLEVYGTVRTSNSTVTHPQAKSILFDCSSKDCDVLAHIPNSEAEIPLPLSRTVVVIPQKSDLIVDVNLFVRCNSEDITIANDSVVFDAVKRSNAITEEQIISGNCGKVKVKLTWMEVLDNDVSGTEEQVEEGLKEEMCIGDGEKIDVEKEDEEAKSVFISDNVCSKERDGKKNDVEKDGDEQAGSEFTFDDECSKEWVGQKLYAEKGHGEIESEFMCDNGCSFKLQDLNTEEDISTRAADGTVKEMLENEDGAQDASLGFIGRWMFSMLEVFSIRIVCSENFNLDEIYGFVLIDTDPNNSLLFSRLHGDPPKIDSQGYALLEGPRRSAWKLYDDNVLIQPLLFKYQDFDFIDEETLDNNLWHDSEYDKDLCKRIGFDMGYIEVNFAVYFEAVQAHIEVLLTECSFSSSEVYGTITATNSMLKHPRASSIVFKKDEPRVDDVCVRLGKEVALPLSRPVIALPLGSILKLVVDIHSQKNSINCPLVFEFPSELTGVSEKILPGNGCFVKVKVNITFR